MSKSLHTKSVCNSSESCLSHQNQNGIMFSTFHFGTGSNRNSVLSPYLASIQMTSKRLGVVCVSLRQHPGVRTYIPQSSSQFNLEYSHLTSAMQKHLSLDGCGQARPALLQVLWHVLRPQWSERPGPSSGAFWEPESFNQNNWDN